LVTPSEKGKPMWMSLGVTVGLISKDGVILASDRKGTYGGRITISKTMRKIYKIDEHIALATTGLSGDLKPIVSLMRAHTSLYNYRSDSPIPVRSAARVLGNILHGSRLYPYLAILIIGGIDKEEGPKLFSIDAVGGISEEEHFVAHGSGASFSLGVLESSYREEMDLKEARDLCIKAVKSAIERDVASGNGIELAEITTSGFRREEVDLE